MKRIVCFFAALLLALTGCGKQTAPESKEYSLSDGKYVTSTALPYLFLGEGRFTVVNDIAVSYQPSGTVRRDGNSVTLEGVYADNDFTYSFTLTDNDTLRFDLGGSTLPMSPSGWNDGIIFTLADDKANDTDDGLDRIEQVEGVPPEFVNIVMENRLKNAVAFSDRLLKVETVSDSITRAAKHIITMTDLYGEPLAVYTVSSDDAYYVSALTATADGGFLFVLGFDEYSSSAADRDEYASRIIKCDKNGEVEFDLPLEGVGGDSLVYCFEKFDRYYFFGDDYVPDVRDFTQTDVFMCSVGKDGAGFVSSRIGGGDYAHLQNVEETDDGFLLYYDAISPTGDFSSGVPTAADWTVAINSRLEVTEKNAEPGRDYNDRRIGEAEGKPVFRSDPVFDGFDAGLPTAFIDYGDFYLIVSEHVTGEYENTPSYINAIWSYTETVYSGYDKDGNLLFRASVDSSPDYDSMTPGLLQRTYPEYFDLDASGGLDVIVWQMSEVNYYFALLEHIDAERDWLDHELTALSAKGVDAAQMREILSTYNVGEDDIHIVPWQNPIS
ncbi:MAG: hypothetical protein IKG80_03705, partial [Clostridia bacterium]|nr:hypothetical protein [Clostridia bacterium]